MATLVSIVSGNFTSASTWEVSNSTAELDSETNNTASTTSFVGSSSFTPGAITIDALGIKLASRSGAPSGTFTIELFNATAAASVAGTTVTINITDFDSNAGGWYFFKFSPVTLLAATLYQVRIKTSVNAMVNLYRDATAGNWSRILRTTTTQAPANTDKLVVSGDFTTAATYSVYTVVMNNTTNATTFGEVQICNKGILSWGTTSSTNYYLKIAGNLNIYGGGTHQLGTSGTPIPSTSTAKLEFANTVNVQFGVEARNGSTLTGYGATKTVKAFLATDASAAATSLTTNVSTGWKNGDVIALASTTRTSTEAEAKSLTADAVGTTLTITALTNAHSGTSPTIGELANLTRNVQIFGTSTTFQAYVNIANTCIADLNYIEFYNMGSATASKRGIDVATTTGSCNIKNCSIHNFTVASSFGINVNSASGNNYTLDNNVLYLTANSGIVTSATTGVAYSVINNLVIRALAGLGLNLGDLNGTITGNTATSCAAAGIQWSDLTYVNGTINNNVAHSNATIGHQFVNLTDVFGGSISIKNFTAWRNNTFGVTLSNVEGMYIDGITVFGNLTSNIERTGGGGNTRVINIVSNSGTTLTCPIGLSFAADSPKFIVDNSTFGVTTTHSTADISVRTSNTYVDALFRNCQMSSTTPIANYSTNTTRGSIIAFQKFQKTAGSHKAYRYEGIISIDTTIFHNASPSSRMTPSFSTIKLYHSPKKINIANGKTCKVSVWVRKSVIGDGVAYNGSQPRLIVKANPALGSNSDVVLATASASSGTWELLTGTTTAVTDNGVLEVLVDCDGTTGWINVDDWSVI
jgi:hypothetical protein